MAELSYKGIRVGGSKLILILPLLGTIAGGLWGGFELWHRYQAMEVKINKYVAPDLSGFDKRIAIVEKTFKKELKSLRQEVKTIQDSVITASDYTRDIKNDLKKQLMELERQIDGIEQRGKDAFKLVRSSIETNDTKVRKMVSDSSDRFDTRREQMRSDMNNMENRVEQKIKDMQAGMKSIEKRINDKVDKALRNPLSKLRGGG